MNLYETVVRYLSECNHKEEQIKKEKGEMLKLMDEKLAERGGYKALEEELNAIILSSGC